MAPVDPVRALCPRTRRRSPVRFATTVRLIAAARIGLGVVIAGGLFGVYEHFARNLAFEHEIRPGTAPTDLLGEAAQGASPLLASGILMLGAVLAFAATLWREAS